MRFDAALSLLISATIGAGVFALPAFARPLGIYSLVFILLAFLYSIFLSYTILNFAPGTVEDDVEKILGRPAREILECVDKIIILLALSAYAIAMNSHLKMNPLILLIFLFIPLFLNLHFPAAFSFVLAISILIFLSATSIYNLHIISSYPSPSLNAKIAALLLFSSYFAFFNHNMIPRIRNILRRIPSVKNAVDLSAFLAFLAYAPFTLTTLALGEADLSTKVLVEAYSPIPASLVAIFSILLFYTSFILLGLHLQEKAREMVGSAASLAVIAATAFLYMLAYLLKIPFSVQIATAGFCVSIYGLIVGIAGMKAKKRQSFMSQMAPYITTLLSIFPLILFLF